MNLNRVSWRFLMLIFFAVFGLAKAGRFGRGFSELFIKTAQVIVADIARNFDNRFALRQPKRRIGDADLMQISVRRESEIF